MTTTLVSLDLQRNIEIQNIEIERFDKLENAQKIIELENRIKSAQESLAYFRVYAPRKEHKKFIIGQYFLIGAKIFKIVNITKCFVVYQPVIEKDNGLGQVYKCKIHYANNNPMKYEENNPDMFYYNKKEDISISTEDIYDDYENVKNACEKIK